MRKLLLSAAIMGAATVASAGDHFYQGASLGYVLWDEERFEGGIDNTSGIVGLQLGYEFLNSGAAVEISASTDLNGPEINLYELAWIDYIGTDGGPLRPYWLAGVARSDGQDGAIVDEATSGIVGLGLSSDLSDRIEFRVDGRVYPAFDTNSVSGIRDWGLKLALNYHFGDRHSHSVAPAPAPKPVAAPAPAPEPVRRAAPVPVAPPEVEEVRTITIQLNVEFETNSANVAGVYGDEIQEVANAMRSQQDIQLVLEGHTDSKGSESYNQSLSQRRVESVKQILSSQYGIPSHRISAVGYGEARPIADNETEAGRARNRRVVGVLSWEEVVK